MGSKKGVVVLSIAAAVALAIWWLLRSDAGDRTAAPAGAQPVADSGPPVASVATGDGSAFAPKEGGVAAPAGGRVPAEEPSRHTVLRGRCVDGDGAPLAGCRVRLHGWGAGSERLDAYLRENGAPPDWQSPPVQHTGADGRFSFSFVPPPPFQFALDLSCEGRVSAGGRWLELDVGQVVDCGDVLLGRGCTVRGRVVDGDGVPQPDVTVMFSGDRERGTILPNATCRATSESSGAFACRSLVPAGEYGVRVTGGNASLLSPRTVSIAEGESSDLVVVVDRRAVQPTITGRVVDETGAPAEGVFVTATAADNGRTHSSRSGRDGTFRIERRPGDDSDAVVLTMQAPAYEVFDAADREVAWGASDVQLAVRRAGHLTVRVTDEGARPVERYSVRLIPTNRLVFSPGWTDVRSHGPHENGVVVLDRLGRGDWQLVLEFPEDPGFELVLRDFTHEGGDLGIDVRATLPVRRAVRVVTGDGSPVAGSLVEVCRLSGDPMTEQHRVRDLRDILNGNRGSVLRVSQATTDAEGRAELVGPAAEAVGVRVTGKHLPRVVPQVRLDVAEELVVRVGSGATLVGRVVPVAALEELKRLAGGRTEPRPELQFESAQRRLTSENDRENFAIDERGAFSVSGLPPGTWTVLVNGWVKETGSPGMSGRMFGTGQQVTLVDGETTECELDLASILPGKLEGLVMLDGAPYAGQVVTVKAEHVWQSLTTDADGRFTFEYSSGSYRILLQPRDIADTLGFLGCGTEARIVEGETNRQTFVVRAGELAVSLVHEDGRPVEGARVLASPLDAAGQVVGPRTLPGSDARGVARMKLTAGRYALRTIPKALVGRKSELRREAAERGETDPFAGHWIELGEVVAESGTVEPVRITLPAGAGY